MTHQLPDDPNLIGALLRRYDRPGPRYTSYPTAPHFRSGFARAQLEQHIERGNQALHPLSLYVHVPYCTSPCFYCGCNRVITRDVSRGIAYAQRLEREIALVAPLFERRRSVVQLHFGGGTPNFLALPTLAGVLGALDERFTLSTLPERDFSIELDPRGVPSEVRDYTDALARLGFNRASIGVQDFDPEVQRAVNRIQSTTQTLALLEACRESGFRSVNLDLIYGLPRQTLAGFQRTLRTVVEARPERLAVYGYAHLPQMFKAQRHIAAADLPSPETRLALLTLAIEELTAAGYHYIGMDHFALPGDELVRAQHDQRLQRNFMGYTTHAGCDLLGLGVSAISSIGDSYSQNYRELRDWERAIDAGELALWRGLTLSRDDRIRGEVIGRLMCHGSVEYAAIEGAHGIRFGEYFARELELLRALRNDGLVEVGSRELAVTGLGRLLVRVVAMCFDAYLPASVTQPLMSQAV